MKKVLSIALVLALALSLSVTAFADDTKIEAGTGGEPAPNTASTAVTFRVNPTYTITIPEKVELTEKVDADTGAVTYEQEAKITADAGMRLLEGQSIQVTLISSSGFNLTTAANASYKLPYTVTVGGSGGTIASGGTVATFGTSSGAQASTLCFAAANPTYAGEYSDTVTFNIAIVTPASAGNGGSAEP